MFRGMQSGKNRESKPLKKRPLKMFFVFALSCMVYLLYFLEAYPGCHSLDILYYMIDFLNGSVYLNSWGSYFYHFYILIFFSITKDLSSLGLFQVMLASAINAYCWYLLDKFCGARIAFIVVLLMIFSPLNGIMAAWYHRSSLFGWLVFLNLLLLYKFIKTKHIGRKESFVFLINALLISFVRIDGMIISLISILIAMLACKLQRITKILVITLFVLLTVVCHSLPKYYSRIIENGNSYKAFCFMYPVGRVIRDLDMEFTDEDLSIVERVVGSESDRKLWLEGKQGFETRINGELNGKELKDFAKWSTGFLLRNFYSFAKMQGSVFVQSALLGGDLHMYYYIPLDWHKEKEQWQAINEKVDISHKHYARFPTGILSFIEKYAYDEDLTNFKKIFVALFFGISVPFVMMFLYFISGLMLNNKTVMCLIPIMAYSVFMFFFQPLPKCTYWYYLYYSYYFIVIVLGYEIFAKKESV